jgi:hypothetical protein
MDDNVELKNLKKYLYVLCQKIAGIKSKGANRKEAFLKEYKIYFLLFVHRISGYYKKKGEDIVNITRLELIDSINGLIDEKKRSLTDIKEKELDNIIDSLISHLHLDNIRGKKIETLEDLNQYLYKGNKKNANGKFEVENKIDNVKEKIARDGDLTEYYSFINTMIHKINPLLTSGAIIEYVNKYFYIAELNDKNTEEDLKIRKVFMIYLINNIIYYYIILKYDDSQCDKKIRFIFYNRYIKFSKIDMVAPQKNGQYTVLNEDIIKRFKSQSHLFDLTNNIIQYEHQYLSNCEDYNESIKKVSGVKVFENQIALAKYNEISTEYVNTYKEYNKAYEAYVKDKNATTENNLRNAVYKFNEVLFCCFTKYIELNFKNKIDAITNEHIERISTYVASIKNYNDSCKICPITYTEESHIEKLNTLRHQIELVMTEQITSLLLSHDKESKNTMNDSINMVIEIEKNIQEIYDELLNLSTNEEEKKKIVHLEKKYEKTEDSTIITHNQMMREIISKLKIVKYYKYATALSTIYKTLKEIVDKIDIPNLTFDKLKTCCLEVSFMDENTFIGDKDDTGTKTISSIIYNKAKKDIDDLIERYKNVYATVEAIENADKIDAYLQLIEDIKNVETKAQEEKTRMLARLAEAREKAIAAYKLTEETNGKINEIDIRINSAIKKADRYLEEEETLYKRYISGLDLKPRDIMYDTEQIRRERFKQINDFKEKKDNINAEIAKLKVLIATIYRLANDAKTKAYIGDENKEEEKNIKGIEINGIEARLNDAINNATEAITKNKEANTLLDTIEELLKGIRFDLIFVNELSSYLLKDFNKEELNKLKGDVDNSVDVAINVGEAIDDAIKKREGEEELEELNKLKGDVDNSVDVAIGVGNAIEDTIKKREDDEELEELKGDVDSSVNVAINVGNAIDDAIKKQEDEEELEELNEIKGAVDDSVGVAIGVGNAIEDTIKKQEDEEELEVLKGDVDSSVGVAIGVGKAIDDAIKKQEDDEELKELKGDVDSSVGVAIDVGNAIDDAEDAEVLKDDVDGSVDVAINVGKAIDDADDEELEELKGDVDGSVGVAIDVGNAIPKPRKRPEIINVSDKPHVGFEPDDEEHKQEPEPEPEPVKVKRRIDEQYVKGNYLDPGLFKEVKEGDLKEIREYHAEQVRNKFRPKPGAIARMDAEIDKFNYPQTGGGSGGGGGDTGDMIQKLNRFENDINNPIEAFEIKFEDRLVFIIATFFIRYVAVSIIQRGIDSNMVKSFYEGFIYYGVIYILLFWFIVLFINIDNNYTVDYIDVNNLAIYIRSVFYYFYMGTNGISRLAIHSLLILIIIIIPILLNIKNTKARDTLNEDDEDEVKLLSLEERTKLSKALSLFTLFIWILTSIIASKF